MTDVLDIGKYPLDVSRLIPPFESPSMDLLNFTELVFCLEHLNTQVLFFFFFFFFCFPSKAHCYCVILFLTFGGVWEKALKKIKTRKESESLKCPSLPSLIQ